MVDEIVTNWRNGHPSPGKNPVRCFAVWPYECKPISIFPVGENQLQHRQEIGYVILNTSFIVNSLFFDSVATQNVNGLTEKKLEDFEKLYFRFASSAFY